MQFIISFHNNYQVTMNSRMTIIFDLNTITKCNKYNFRNDIYHLGLLHLYRIVSISIIIHIG